MSEVNPLVQRVDALLKRHQQQSANAQAEEAPRHVPDHPPAPVLVPLPGLADSGEPPPDAPQDDIPVLTEIVESAEIPATTTEYLNEAMVAQIEGAVLEKVLTGLDSVLDQRLGRTVSDLLEQAMDGLRADLSANLRELVREAVATAVRKELAERELAERARSV